ncbi:MAG TPA: hypothetical protein VK780_00930 [Thermoanaerobaculia bacterium]|nr:hypothetical protein [Thermoanaerobaculia bacterium]
MAPDDAGPKWDTEALRREREEGWFRQNEARLIECPGRYALS